MKPVTRHVAATIAVLVAASAVAVAVFIGSGAYDVGADEPHTAVVASALGTLRDRSIDARARQLEVPADLGDIARIVRGAGNYDAMCVGCHLAPGMDATELSGGLYPEPPDFTKQRTTAARAFWVIKHGIKASGMPAWGRSMGDEHVWDLAAFLLELPGLDEAQYATLVGQSEGHSHGGGETSGHGHGGDAHGRENAGHHEAPSTGRTGANAAAVHDRPDAHDHAPAAARGRTHVHADGREHVHGPKRPADGAAAR